MAATSPVERPGCGVADEPTDEVAEAFRFPPERFFPEAAFPEPAFAWAAFPEPAFAWAAFPEPAFAWAAFREPVFAGAAFAEAPFVEAAFAEAGGAFCPASCTAVSVTPRTLCQRLTSGKS